MLDYIWHPSRCACESDEYLGIIKDDSVITCGKTIEPTKAIQVSFNDEKATCKNKQFLHFTGLLINYHYWLIMTIDNGLCILFLLPHTTLIKAKAYIN